MPQTQLKISELPVAGSVNGTDVLAVVDGGATKQVSVTTLLASAGTVTSVDVAVPADMTSTGGPIIASGTITLARATQTANTVFAGPSNGAGATPTYRALVAADIPAIAESGVTNLTADLGNKALAARLISTTAPITGGGDLSADRTLAIAKSTASVDGYLAATDFTIFNAKVATTRTINTTSPITGGGDLSADRTIAMPVATASANGYLASADFTTFNNKVAMGLAMAMAAGYSVPLTN